MSDITRPGRELHQSFKALGTLFGKTSDQIIKAVGSPTSISLTGNNQKLYQWQATGCHIALLFDAEGNFITITHEYANYAEEPNIAAAVIVWVVIIGLGILFGILRSS